MCKNILYSLLLIATFLQGYTQPNDDIAFAGKNAIFIYHGFAPASPQYPDANGNTGFILQRREKGGATQWVTINNFHSPQSALELTVNYQKALGYFPAGRNLAFDAVEAWQKWQQYKVYDSLLNEIGFPPGQMAFGILVADTTVQAGKTYQYRIVKNIITTPADSTFTSNNVGYPARIDAATPKLLRRQTEGDAITLTWSGKGYKTSGNFNVYRATGNEKKFHLITPDTRVTQNRDFVEYTVYDKNVGFSEMYRYYIEPVNGFGGGGNVVSDTVPATCMNPQQLQTPQSVYTSEDQQHKAIIIHYVLPDYNYIGSVHIMRSNNFDTGFAEIGINKSEDTSFADYRITAGVKYYYFLLMTDKMGRNSPRSIKTFGLYQDTTNDFPARFTKAENTTGGIKITWQNPPSPELLSGYYVYRNDGGGNGFQRITALLPVQDSVNAYVDTSKVIRPGTLYSYAVQSENLSNRLSKNSNIAYITTASAPEDKTLTTPKNVRAVIDNSNALLLWYDMRVLNNNLACYRIYRKAENDSSFIKIEDKYPASFSSYTDTTIVPGLAYEYAVESADDAGHASARAITNTIRITALPLPAPVLSVFKAESGVVLTWEEVMDARVHQYIVYRYIKGQQPAKIGTVNAKETSFTDKNVTTQKTYYYFLQADTENRPLTALASNKAYVFF